MHMLNLDVGRPQQKTKSDMTPPSSKEQETEANRIVKIKQNNTLKPLVSILAA